MKTVRELLREISEQNKVRQAHSSSSRDINKAKKRVEYLTRCLEYLKTNPSSDYLDRQIILIETRIESARQKYQTWLSYQNTATKEKPKHLNNPKFEKEAGIVKMKEELKTIKFIASR